ncbi:ABC transporter permease [Chryseolinea sp. T2]|uniref:ABC transporter permease n=1 Tax=Chryseolinea sp. T2 TaxID=3129255 RepID=UPI0030771072
MIRYYVTIALRNIARNKGFAVSNIGGFAIGLTAFLLIILFVADELNYDTFNEKHRRIFRVDTELKYGGAVTSFALAAPPVAEAMRQEFPEVQKAARIERALNIQLKIGQEVIQEERAVYADQSIFEVFTLDVIDGTPQNALTDPASIVISESIALKYFNTTNAVGKSLITANDNSLYTVSAVVKDMPRQSHFHADLILPLQGNAKAEGTHYNQFSFNTYVLLNSKQNAEGLAAKLPQFLRKHLGTDMNVDAFEKGGNYIRLALTPLDDIHLLSNKQRELESNSDIAYVYIFAAIAVLILILACINFTNLFTARSANRLREVGVRKVMGSVRGNIVLQFLVEAFVMTLISILMSVVLAVLLLPAFNALSGKEFKISFIDLAAIVPLSIVLTMIVSIIAGLYPAVYLSSFQPAKVLKSEGTSGFKGSRLRSVLVVFQFGIATSLVLGTIVILHQMKFIQSRNIGFNREQVLVINNAGSMDDPVLLQQNLKQVAGVVNASISGYLPTNDARWQSPVSVAGQQGVMTEFWTVDCDYVSTLQMNIVSGRNFIADAVGDSTSIIINETTAITLFEGEDPLQKELEANGKHFTVIGVVKDFNFTSLRQNVTPLVMTLGSDWRASLIVRTAPGQFEHVLAAARESWQQLNPDHDFEFSFMDEDFAAVYRSEKQMEKLFTIFAVLSIVIAGIGLFGLAAYAAEQRTRELSIRKVLGASVSNLFVLITFDFMRLIIISVALALPLGWWTMEQWLNGFAYRITIPTWSFLVSAAMILIVGAVTISYQMMRVALKNPVDSLRKDH